MADKKLQMHKKFLDPVKDSRKDREKYMVSLRKKKKQDIFKDKRIKIMQEDSKGQVAQEDDGKGAEENEFMKKNLTAPSVRYEKVLKPLVPGIYEESIPISDILTNVHDVLQQNEGLTKDEVLALIAYVREAMWKSGNGIIEVVIEKGIFNILCNYMSEVQHEDLIFEIT